MFNKFTSTIAFVTLCVALVQVNAQDSSSSEVVSIPSPSDTVGPSLPITIEPISSTLTTGSGSISISDSVLPTDSITGSIPVSSGSVSVTVDSSSSDASTLSIPTSASLSSTPLSPLSSLSSSSTLPGSSSSSTSPTPVPSPSGNSAASFGVGALPYVFAGVAGAFAAL